MGIRSRKERRGEYTGRGVKEGMMLFDWKCIGIGWKFGINSCVGDWGDVGFV